MSTVTVKIDRELKERMQSVKINWSECIRESIRRRVELEERRDAALKLLRDLKARRDNVPKDFINQSIREMREAR